MAWMGFLKAGQSWSLKVAAALSNTKNTALMITWIKTDGSKHSETDQLEPGVLHDNKNAKVPTGMKRVYVYVDLPVSGTGDIVVAQKSSKWVEHLTKDTQWVFDINK